MVCSNVIRYSSLIRQHLSRTHQGKVKYFDFEREVTCLVVNGWILRPFLTRDLGIVKEELCNDILGLEPGAYTYARSTCDWEDLVK